MKKITATIITFNEELRIDECLKSLSDVADEIIVIDSFSTDNTVAICNKYPNCRVTQRRFAGYGAQKQYAVSLSTNSYILSIDADEILDDDLKASILDLKQNGFTHRIYGVNRLNFFCNNPVRHCGWYPDFQIRLFDKRYASWNLRDVFESVIFPGSLRPQAIKGKLLHYRCSTPQEHRKKETLHASINAQILINEHGTPSFITPYNKWIGAFIGTYIFKLGFLDAAGWQIALTHAHASFVKYMTARKLSKRQ